MKKIICWIFVALWMGVIFLFSSYNGLESTKQSKGFLYHTIGNIIDIFDSDMDPVRKDEIIDKIDPVIRKIAHTSVYFVLGLFVCLALNCYKITNKQLILYGLLICVLYSCSDEIHQLYVPGRSGEILDVFIDTIGSGLSIIMFYKLRKSLHK